MRAEARRGTQQRGGRGQGQGGRTRDKGKEGRGQRTWKGSCFSFFSFHALMFSFVFFIIFLIFLFSYILVRTVEETKAGKRTKNGRGREEETEDNPGRWPPSKQGSGNRRREMEHTQG
jgi:flagellar biosynthesis/type III secretory pathway M-ring protein FliF/YscJ